MKIELTFLNSRVARRIFALFIFCALVPILALAIISFVQVREQLHSQSQRRLSLSSKALGMSIVERLSFLEDELKVFSCSLNTRPGASTYRPAEEYSEILKEHFKGLAQINDSGKCISFFGPSEHPAAQSEEEKYLSSGKTLIVTQPGKDDCLHIYMLRAVDLQDPSQGILCGEIDPVYLCGSRDKLPPP